MKSWEKEQSFEDSYRSGRYARNIWKYIPAKFDEAVDDVGVDSDGYWVYLTNNYTAYDGGEDCGIIHEYNIADLKAAIKTIRQKEV